MDYDNKDLSLIVAEIEKLQFIYNLSDFYILSTENGYNAFCLDKLPFNDLLVIYQQSKLVCKDFIKYCTKRKHFTLRMSGFKELILICKSVNCFYSKSNAHKIFFNEIMSYHFNDGSNFDNETSINLESYNSTKHGVYLNEGNKKT